MNFFLLSTKKTKQKTINWTIILLILLIFLYLFIFSIHKFEYPKNRKKNKRYGLIKDYREFKINVKIVLIIIIKQIYIKETNF